jgi:hypothetical protein
MRTIFHKKIHPLIPHQLPMPPAPDENGRWIFVSRTILPSPEGEKKPITELTQSWKMLLRLFPLSSHAGHSENLNRITPAVQQNRCQKSVLAYPVPSYFLSTGGIL